MITIVSYTNATEAYRAKELLENNGIHCKLQGDMLSSGSEPIGKIEVLIDSKDVKLARDVLANAISDD